MWENRAKQNKLEVAFAGRERISDDAFYERFFRSSGVPKEVVAKIKKALEEEFDTDFSRLSPADDLTGNLSFLDEYDSLARVELVARLEADFGITITDAEAERTHSIENIVDLVWGKLRQI